MQYFFPATMTIYDLDLSLIVTKTATMKRLHDCRRRDLVLGYLRFSNSDTDSTGIDHT